MLGDKDGFGTGLQEDDAVHLPAGTAQHIDYRMAGDPRFTDICPADLGYSNPSKHKIEFEKLDIRPAGINP